MTKTILNVLAGLLLTLALGAGVARADNGGIRIEQAWGRATPGNAKTGAFYLSITNTGSAPDRLTAASTPAANSVQLHETIMVNNVMEMRPLPSVTIEPGKTVVFEPGHDHIMLMGLKAPLKAGDKVPLTLTFDHAGAQQVMVAIGKVGAMKAGDSESMPGMSDMPGMQH